jgi:hypothetical protein
MPVLAIGAEWGYGAASEHMMRRVAKDVQGAIIERCGHYPAEERPSELARAIIDVFSAATIDNTLSISTLPDARITAGDSIVPRRATVTGSGPAKK